MAPYVISGDPIYMRCLNLIHTCGLCVIASIAVHISGCSLTQFKPTPAQHERSALTITDATKPRGIFIVIHGLNQRPSSMDPLCDYLHSLGFHTYRLTLSGHDDHPQRVFPPAQWQRDLLDGYTHLRLRFPTLPINVLGYSLGGLLATSTLDSYPVFSPARMILFAPGLALRPLAQAGQITELVPPLRGGVPSLAPVEYKRFESTPIFFYQNTLALYSQTRQLRSIERLQHTPTIIFANPADNLISLAGLQDWISANNLSGSWRVIPVHPSPAGSHLSEHLVIDQQSLGEQEWTLVKESMKNFLKLDQEPAWPH